MLLAFELPSLEYLFFLVAILIGIGGKLFEASRSVRRKSLEAQKKRDRRFGDDLGKTLQTSPAPLVPSAASVRPVPPVVPSPLPMPVPRPIRRRPPRLRPHSEAAPLPPEPPAPPEPRVAPPLRRQPAAPPPHLPGARGARPSHPVVKMLRAEPETVRNLIAIRAALGPPRSELPWYR